MTPLAIPPPLSLLGQKLAGLTIVQWIDSNATSHWFEAKEDAGTKRLLYVYVDKLTRDRARTRIHGFRTTADDLGVAGIPDAVLHVSVGDYRLMMPTSLRQHLIGVATRPLEIVGYRVDEVLGPGYKGVTYRVHRAKGPATPYALKLTVAEEYEGRSHLPELNRMVDLASTDRDHFPQLHEHDEWTCHTDAGPHRLLVFVEDFIRGQSLADYLDSHRATIAVTFLESFLREMLAALGVLQGLDLMHDDLHAGNIIIHETLAAARPYVIDFGSTKPRGTTKKVRDDIRQLASHISDIANAVSSRMSARTRYEENVLAAVESLLAHMSDDDPLRRPDDARELLEQFDSYFTRGSLKQTLTHPFDFGNAEEVLDNQLLYMLAAKSFPWSDRLESSAHLLVIGPRGCGKTTVFRAMSFFCLAEAGEIDNALGRPYVGLYISCNKEFRQRFSALPGDILRERASDLRHYFNLLVVRELTSALLACTRAERLAEADVRTYRRFLGSYNLCDSVGHPDPEVSLQQVHAAIVRALHHGRSLIAQGAPSDTLTDQGFVADLAFFINGQLSPFLGKVVYLLVDDYTERKVPREVQQALNHILFVPNSLYKAKISSEVFGVAPDDSFGAFLDQDRDYKEWNLGTLYYLNLPSDRQKEFLREVVDNRLELCGFGGRVADTIGASRYEENSLSRALKLEAEARSAARQDISPSSIPALLEGAVERVLESQSKNAYYHGRDTICDLCTGDVGNILELLSRLYSECGVTKRTMAQIAPVRQSAIIQAYSLQYIAKIKGIPLYGDKLFELVDAFGTMSAMLLKEHPWQERPPERRDPYQLLRIGRRAEAFR